MSSDWNHAKMAALTMPLQEAAIHKASWSSARLNSYHEFPREEGAVGNK